ncbi:hypothetical protein PTSG_03828 [Salpingoeca rosetta]|uniref:Uncharacterized protein n=1 Tax=Salpingoeca rosetta (strain ATCC 50818 / BSB-021) TaxID=946362 RepID=F2U5I1_SALR5|nr:uncharacterized protein PTSG_03828 [Salpingoeca rosetta]EGD83197.1 hypothetical protein PTSG_03828 [Salpingoeca rosetta]|eukprot:XP_004995561.1 hypothetical protein PTSG_03828 [Salpingoeca rosetta]
MERELDDGDTKRHMALLVSGMTEAFAALEAQVPPEHIETLARLIVVSMSGPHRVYHSSHHVFAVVPEDAASDPLAYLAAAFHDVVYLQVDDGIAPCFLPILHRARLLPLPSEEATARSQAQGAGQDDTTLQQQRQQEQEEQEREDEADEDEERLGKRDQNHAADTATDITKETGHHDPQVQQIVDSPRLMADATGRYDKRREALRRPCELALLADTLVEYEHPWQPCRRRRRYRRHARLNSMDSNTSCASSSTQASDLSFFPPSPSSPLPLSTTSSPLLTPSAPSPPLQAATDSRREHRERAVDAAGISCTRADPVLPTGAAEVLSWWHEDDDCSCGCSPRGKEGKGDEKGWGLAGAKNPRRSNGSNNDSGNDSGNDSSGYSRHQHCVWSSSCDCAMAQAAAAAEDLCERRARAQLLCYRLFGHSSGELLPFEIGAQGLNEFLSCVVAMDMLAPWLTEVQLLYVCTCIEATIPFRVQASVDLLYERCTSALTDVLRAEHECNGWRYDQQPQRQPQRQEKEDKQEELGQQEPRQQQRQQRPRHLWQMTQQELVVAFSKVCRGGSCRSCHSCTSCDEACTCWLDTAAKMLGEEAVAMACAMAARDVSNFAAVDTRSFVINTWKLLPELNTSLRDRRGFTLKNWMAALAGNLSYFGFLLSNPFLVFPRHGQCRSDDEQAVLLARTFTNLSRGRAYVGARFVTATISHALLTLAGVGVDTTPAWSLFPGGVGGALPDCGDDDGSDGWASKSGSDNDDDDDDDDGDGDGDGDGDDDGDDDGEDVLLDSEDSGVQHTNGNDFDGDRRRAGSYAPHQPHLLPEAVESKGNISCKQGDAGAANSQNQQLSDSTDTPFDFCNERAPVCEYVDALLRFGFNSPDTCNLDQPACEASLRVYRELLKQHAGQALAPDASCVELCVHKCLAYHRGELGAESFLRGIPVDVVDVVAEHALAGVLSDEQDDEVALFIESLPPTSTTAAVPASAQEQSTVASPGGRRLSPTGKVTLRATRRMLRRRRQVSALIRNGTTSLPATDPVTFSEGWPAPSPSISAVVLQRALSARRRGRTRSTTTSLHAVEASVA